MSVEEASRAFYGFMAMGIQGLMTPVPMRAEGMAEAWQGRWELYSRYTNGGNTPYAGPDNRTLARGELLYERVDGESNALNGLTTMWTAENLLPRDEAIERYFQDSPHQNDETFFWAHHLHINFRQIDDYTVEYSDEGELIGNYGDFRQGFAVSCEADLMRFGSTEVVLQSRDTAAEPIAPASVGMIIPTIVSPLPGRVDIPMSGVPPTFGNMRTLDTVDTYIKRSDDPPLVGGWEPIESYYKRLNGGFFPEGLSNLKAHI
jgi:hypothetical protein